VTQDRFNSFALKVPAAMTEKCAEDGVQPPCVMQLIWAALHASKPQTSVAQCKSITDALEATMQEMAAQRLLLVTAGTRKKPQAQQENATLASSKIISPKKGVMKKRKRKDKDEEDTDGKKRQCDKSK
jgi:hypothetical protein